MLLPSIWESIPKAVFSGKGLILGGSHSPNLNSNHSLVGDLSAILIQNVHPLVNYIRVPSKEIALMSEFEPKMEAIANSTIHANVTNLSGVPSWMLVLVKHILEKTGKQSLEEVWPNLEVFFHGGMAFTPYREQYRLDSCILAVESLSMGRLHRCKTLVSSLLLVASPNSTDRLTRTCTFTSSNQGAVVVSSFINGGVPKYTPTASAYAVAPLPPASSPRPSSASACGQGVGADAGDGFGHQVERGQGHQLARGEQVAVHIQAVVGKH